MRRFMFLVVVLICSPALFGQAPRTVFEVSGRFATAGVPNGALDGASFRLTVSIDPNATAATVERNGQGQVAVYSTSASVLTISRAADASLNGAFPAAGERLEISDSFTGEDCLTFRSTFKTPGGDITVPTACFAAGTLAGVNVPAALPHKALTGFRTTRFGRSEFGVLNGSVRIHGGGR